MYDLFHLITGEVILSRLMTHEEAHKQNLLFRRRGVDIRYVIDHNSVYEKSLAKQNFREFLKDLKNEVSENK